jgi:hypothetical protein
VDSSIYIAESAIDLGNDSVAEEQINAIKSNLKYLEDNMAIEAAKNMGHDELSELLKAFSGQMPKLDTLLRKLQYR